MQRPSAGELLSHPFVADALSPPDSLMQLVGEYAQRKRPVVPQRGPSPNEYSTVSIMGIQGTTTTTTLQCCMQHFWQLPAATCAPHQVARPQCKRTMHCLISPTCQGTLPTWDFGGNKAAATTGRHAAALGTLRGVDAGSLGRDARSLTGGSAGSFTGSLTGAAGSGAVGSGSFTGTTRTASGTGPATGAVGTGTIARADKWPGQQAAAAAAAAAGSSSDRDADNSGSGQRGVYKRLPSLQALSVDVGHVPGSGVAAGLPQGSGVGPEVTILRRFSRQESGAVAGEGDAALGRLLLPALRSLVQVPGGPEQAAVDSVSAALQQLERQIPGATARLLSEAMLQLSISDSPQLSKLLAAARSVFGAAGAPGGGTAGPPTAGAAAGSSGLAGAQHGHVRSSGGAPGAAPAAAAALDPGIAGIKAGAAPDLGLLGNFLLARWREDTARSAAAAARSRTAL